MRRREGALPLEKTSGLPANPRSPPPCARQRCQAKTDVNIEALIQELEFFCTRGPGQAFCGRLPCLLFSAPSGSSTRRLVPGSPDRRPHAQACPIAAPGIDHLCVLR